MTKEKESCFFSSDCVRLDELVKITIMIKGKRGKPPTSLKRVKNGGNKQKPLN